MKTIKFFALILCTALISVSLFSCNKATTIEIDKEGYWVINGVRSDFKAQGVDGKDGITPTVEIDENGYWVINGDRTDVKAKNDPPADSEAHEITIMTSAFTKFYFESPDKAQGSNLLFMFTDTFYLRGKATVDMTWQTFKSLFADRIVLSPEGIECIEIPHNFALFVDNNNSLTIEKYVDNISQTKTPIFIVSSGNVCGGIGEYLYTRFLADEKYKSYQKALLNTEQSLDDGISEYFEQEIDDCVVKMINECTEKSLVFAIITDSHYNGSNNFSNTLKNIKAVNDKYQLDGIYHLGDTINGNKEKHETTALINEVRNSLYQIHPESYIIPGNHDDNSFTSIDEHPYQYTKGEQYSIMCRHKDTAVVRDSNNLYWYKDYDSFGIRIICLDSHMGEGTNGYGSSWGYPKEVIDWVRDKALDTNYQVLFLSHIPLTADYNAYQSPIINSELLRGIIKNFMTNGGTVIGFIHGHTHWDFIGMEEDNTFYEISIGASNTTMSYGPYKPENAVVPDRISGTATEDLWDIVIIQPESRQIKMIRFGAGTDRIICY